MDTGKVNVFKKAWRKIVATFDRILLATPFIGEWVRFSRDLDKVFANPDFQLMRDVVYGKTTFEELLRQKNLRPGTYCGDHNNNIWWLWWGWHGW